jgi:uncharacterized membrane protein
MSDHLQHELKKEFQLERMILFSDAVFAIAITLLVLEIRLPEFNRHTVTDGQLADALGELIPKFIGFMVSFMIIGLYWIIHHRTFGFVINYTRRLLWINLFFLFAIVLMPFSTGFYSSYIVSGVKIPVIVYTCNIVFLGVMNLVLWLYINKPSLNLTEGISREEKRYYAFRASVPPFVFILMAIAYLYVNKRLAVWLPPLIPIMMRVFRKLFFPNYNPNRAKH